MRGILKLQDYSKLIQRWKITNLDYQELASDDTYTFIYADPPYDIKDVLYGNKGSAQGIDHSRFADVMDARLCNVMISYNDHPDIVQRLIGVFMIMSTPIAMRSTGSYMSDQKKRRELICTNYGNLGGACIT